MDITQYIAIAGLVVTVVAVIIGLILQNEKKKIRDLERINKKYKNRLAKSLNAIKGYQLIEEEQAKQIGKDSSIYRRDIRRNYSEYFDSEFLSPKNIESLIQDLKYD